MLPVPTLEELSEFSGRGESEYNSFVNSALAQATLLMRFTTHITEMPEDADLAQVVKNGIMQMADGIYLAQDFDLINASPIVAQTMGSASYSRAAYGKYLEKIKAGQTTGLLWFDLAMIELGEPVNTIASDSWNLFERDLCTAVIDDAQNIIFGPIDIGKSDNVFGVSSQSPGEYLGYEGRNIF